MRQAALLAGAFALTLGLLLVVYVAVSGGGPSGTAAVMSPSPTATPERTVKPKPSPSASGSAAPESAAPTPSPTAEPTPVQTTLVLPSGSPDTTPVPDTTSGTAITVTVKGAAYTAFDVQPNSKVTKLPSGSVLLESTDSSLPTTVMYSLPKSSVPAGRQIARLDTVVCGSGGGMFWEVYGPDGSTPVEYEGQPPEADGCWHFTRAPGTDTTVHADVILASTFRIDMVTFSVWLR